MEETQIVRFRVDNVYRDAAVEIAYNGSIVSSRKKKMLAPGEMEQIILRRAELEQTQDLAEITVSLRKG